MEMQIIFLTFFSRHGLISFKEKLTRKDGELTEKIAMQEPDKEIQKFNDIYEDQFVNLHNLT